ncbi:transposase, partial [Brachybacterium alimentarium]|uniref:transposase n=1 Tax=Brachybacterium alimentarium TaxID=47845 RepID=UPI003FCF8A7E
MASRDEALATATARGEATRLAKRVAALDKELKDITKRITDLVRQSPAGGLLDQPGIGPVTAAIALTSWSPLGRIRSEAAFARLAGASPIPASSGNTVRHR